MNRITAVTVVFDHDIHDEDAAPIIAAIQQIRHVAEVIPQETAGADLIARVKVRYTIRQRLYEAIERIFEEAP